MYKKVTILIVMIFLLSSLGFSGNWILETKKLPADLAAKIEQAGGTLVSTLDEVGIAVAQFSNEADARSMAALGFTVMPDAQLNWVPGHEESYVASIGDDETFYGYQWHLPVIQADKAWDLGVTGSGVRVAVLDTGVWYPHPDLLPNIDFAASASFVPGTPDFMDDHGHGTHVSGIIAAADNDWGSIGVAPNATIIAVKVLGANGSGAISWIVNGIIHAVHQEADVINMSLGGYLKKNGYLPYYTAVDANNLKNLYKKVINWAISQGSLVVIAAGNDSTDLDHMGNVIEAPAQCGSGLIVSATGPVGLTDFDHFASYSNYGKGTVDIAAPGGDYSAYPNPFWWYDMIFSTDIGGWSWGAGTSQATPNVSGVAALILSKYGKMPVPVLINHILGTTDDLGKPGNDDYYGKGRVNAYKAVTK